MTVTARQYTTVAIFILCANWIFGGVAAEWLGFSGSYIARWIMPGAAIGLLLMAAHKQFGAVPSIALWGVGILVGATILFDFGGGLFKPRFNEQTGEVQTMMDPETGQEYRSLTPAECAARTLGYCINPETGTRLVPYDLDQAQQLRRSTRTTPSTLTGISPNWPMSGTRTARVAVDPLRPPSVRVPSCQVGWSENVSIPGGSTVTWNWQEAIARVQYRGAATDGWVDGTPSSRGVTDVRFCVDNTRTGTSIYFNNNMLLEWN